jgi:branched-subunit amino acid aminotransferase/4-amino-4-deoxychorismate lyase
MLDGTLQATSSLRISPFHAGFLFGEGAFETVRVHDGDIRHWPAHEARWRRTLTDWHVPLDTPPPGADERLRAVVAANHLTHGSLKIVAFRADHGWSELIAARPSAYSENDYTRGFRLRSISASSSPTWQGRKTLNYLAHAHARRAARAEGYDEAIWVTPAGRVLEGSGSSFFLACGGQIVTPPLADGILPGTARARILAALPVVERSVSLDEAYAADEVFVTNALFDVMPVAQFDGTHYDLTRNELTRTARAALA